MSVIRLTLVRLQGDYVEGAPNKETLLIRHPAGVAALITPVSTSRHLSNTPVTEHSTTLNKLPHRHGYSLTNPNCSGGKLPRLDCYH